MLNRKVASIKKQSFRGSLHCSEKVPKIHKKTQESLFQLSSTLWICKFIKKKISYSYFLVNFQKLQESFQNSFFFRTTLGDCLCPSRLRVHLWLAKMECIYQIYIRHGQARKCCRIVPELRPTFVQSNSKAPTFQFIYSEQAIVEW